MGIHSITIQYGAASSSLENVDGSIRLHVATPHLLGPKEETLCTSASPVSSNNGFHILQHGDVHFGAALFPFGANHTEAAREAYLQLFRTLDPLSLYRVWHYVPGINQDCDGMEIYRLFCKGRSLAFEERFHESATSQMCAASAVGVGCDQLIVIFAAGNTPAVHLENPEQIPAYQYPRDYGPRPPSFSRGTFVKNDPSLLFLAGTASIKGHESIHAGDSRQQTMTTLENMSLVLAGAGIGPRSRPVSAAGKIYLRNRGDAEWVLHVVEEHFPFLQGNTVCIEAAICRKELDVEIEATLQL